MSIEETKKWIDEETKKWIDEQNIETLLRRWRFAPSGDPMFQGEIGEYYSKRMFALRDADPDAWVLASKEIGR